MHQNAILDLFSREKKDNTRHAFTLIAWLGPYYFPAMHISKHVEIEEEKL
jgi:hypothetical protein